jgi:hypothetical protein
MINLTIYHVTAAGGSMLACLCVGTKMALQIATGTKSKCTLGTTIWRIWNRKTIPFCGRLGQWSIFHMQSLWSERGEEWRKRKGIFKTIFKALLHLILSCQFYRFTSRVDSGVSHLRAWLWHALYFAGSLYECPWKIFNHQCRSWAIGKRSLSFDFDACLLACNSMDSQGRYLCWDRCCLGRGLDIGLAASPYANFSLIYTASL